MGSGPGFGDVGLNGGERRQDQDECHVLSAFFLVDFQQKHFSFQHREKTTIFSFQTKIVYL